MCNSFLLLLKKYQPRGVIHKKNIIDHVQAPNCVIYNYSYITRVEINQSFYRFPVLLFSWNLYHKHNYND